MDIALNTDYLTSGGAPDPYLRMLAEAGFTHLHWCHQWCTDFLYSSYETEHYAKILKEYGLKLLDIHGSAGKEKCWFSTEEYCRKSGVELVRNRIEMFMELEGSGSLMMHIPFFHFQKDDEEKRKAKRVQFEALKRSLDDLMPSLEKHHVRIAVENMAGDTFELIRELMDSYPEEYIGITYDCGHGNIDPCKGLDYLEPLKNRLQALHLHDNDTAGDQHQPPFMGKVDWQRLAGIIASSSYTNRPMSFEIAMRNTPFYEPELKIDQKPENIRAFLADTYERCRKFAEMELAATQK